MEPIRPVYAGWGGGGSGGSDEPPTLWERSARVHASPWRLATLHGHSKRSVVGFKLARLLFSQTKHEIVRIRTTKSLKTAAHHRAIFT